MIMTASRDVNVWRYRRVKILDVLGEKLIPIGRPYELPSFTDAGDLGYSNLTPERQKEVLFNAIKGNCLGVYTPELYPYHDTRTTKIKFKIASGLTPENKLMLQKFVTMLRHVTQVRIYLAKILTNTTCGLIARAVAETIRDYVNLTLPTTVDAIFRDSDGNLLKLESNLQHFCSDMAVLSKTLVKINTEGYVGGEVITYLDRPDVHQMPMNYCAVPVLFNRCIRAAIKHYDAFLEEWLYTGLVTSDRQHEFVIWDLSRSNIVKAADFDGYGGGKPELPFDKRFVFLPDMVPSIWAKDVPKMARMSFLARRLISVLTLESQKPFALEFNSIVQAENMLSQMAIVRSVFEATGTSLLEKINSVINITEFYAFIHELIFDPCAMWMNHFAADLEDYRLAILNATDDPSRMSTYNDSSGLNEIFRDYFNERLRRIVNNHDNVEDVVEMRLYNHNLFRKVDPMDTRFVDYLNFDYDLNDIVSEEGTDGTHSGHDENNPHGGFSSSADIERRPMADRDVQSVQDPKPNAFDSDKPEGIEMPFLERVGIGFSDTLLFQFLVSPAAQEQYNRLFRLRLSLVRADLLLQRKRTSEIQSMNRQEQLFISSVLSFLRRFSLSVFGYQAAMQWDNFASALPKLKSVNPIVNAQRLLLRNINSHCGLFSGKQSISDKLIEIFAVVNDYALNEMGFNDAADRFYEVYTEIRSIVSAPENKLLNKMAYAVFRVPPVLGLRSLQKVPLDPRKGLAPQTNLVRTAAPMRRSISLMGLQPGAGRK